MNHANSAQTSQGARNIMAPSALGLSRRLQQREQWIQVLRGRPGRRVPTRSLRRAASVALVRFRHHETLAWAIPASPLSGSPSAAT